jgi:hypothetical protein
MRVKCLIFVLTAVISLGMIACGGGGGGGGTSYPELAGTWTGVWEQHWDGFDPVQIQYTVKMTIDSKGRNITSVLEDGFDLGITGKITRDSSQVYTVEWDDGAWGGFLVEEGNAHFAYLDDFFYVGIFQKGDLKLPAYQLSDYVGTWTGYSVLVDENMDIVMDGDTVINVDNEDNVFGTTLMGAIAASVQGFVDPVRGVIEGGDPGGNFFVHIFLSVDKMFTASYACPSTYEDYYDCEFGGWAKQ